MICRIIRIVILTASAIFSIISICAYSFAQDGPYLYLMRHADKVTNANETAAEVPDFARDCTQKNQRLTIKGKERAERLGKRLSQAEFKQAFSSKACRTLHTAYLVSGLEPNPSMTKPGQGGASSYAAELIEKLNEAGDNILVVLHSTWLQRLTRSSSFRGEAWPADQCYGEIRRYKISQNGRGFVLDKRYCGEVEMDSNGFCLK